MNTAPNRVLHPAEVVRVAALAPHMARITVQAEALRTMPIELPGQWLKVFFPREPGSRAHGRAYTIRAFDAAAGLVDMDFVLHGTQSRASAWATQARPGEVLEVAGPREGYRIDPLAADHLLVGDSTALPAIAAILEALPPDATPHVFLELTDDAEAALVPAHPKAKLEIHITSQALSGTTGQVLQAVKRSRLPATLQAFVAGEATMMRAVRTHLLKERGIEPSSVDASGYWRVGVADHRDSEG